MIDTEGDSTMLTEHEARALIVAAGRHLFSLGWLPARAGNISLALDDRWLLTTPAGICKGHLHPDDLVVVDREGRPREPLAAPASTELALHLAVYRVRPAVRACVHTHAPNVIACSVAGVSLETPVLPEVILTLGRIPTVPYAMTGTSALAAAVEPVIAYHDAAVLEHHGTVAVGTTLAEAVERTELMEHAAAVLVTAQSLGGIRPLAADHVRALLQLRRSRGGRPESEPRL